MQIGEVAELLNDQILASAGERFFDEKHFYVERPAANGFLTWTVFETLPSSGWKTSVVIRQDVREIPRVEKIRILINIGIGVMLGILGMTTLIFRPQVGQTANIWAFSVTVGIAILLGIAWVWEVIYTHPLENGSRTALVNNSDVGIELLEIERSEVAQARGVRSYSHRGRDREYRGHKPDCLPDGLSLAKFPARCRRAEDPAAAGQQPAQRTHLARNVSFCSERETRGRLVLHDGTATDV
jgi:hypothetical protein